MPGRGLVRYIHRNPVAITGEIRLASYRWSSLRAYIGARTEPAWLTTDLVLAVFGGREHLLRATIEPTGELAPVCARADLLAAIDLVLDDHAIGDVAMVDRAVRTLLVDRLGGDAVATLLGEGAARSPAALRNAFSRARRRATAQPELVSVVEGVADLVA